MLPTQPDLKNSIKKIIDSNPYQSKEIPVSDEGEKAIDYFCNQLSILILQILTQAQVIMPTGSIQTTVTTTTGAGSGVNIAPANGKLQ